MKREDMQGGQAERSLGDRTEIIKESISAPLEVRRDQFAFPDTDEQDYAGLAERRAVQRMIEIRRLRQEFFADELLGEPAWDMLLELFAKHLDNLKTATRPLCDASGVPPTTALRWIGKLDQQGLIVREVDRSDTRRTLVSLSDKGVEQVRQFVMAVNRESSVAG